eukprot:TRINITY_DN836_c0_g1_i1.p1 TRINITY_DN836_c0_g1~~TRINITY_DN836_c0_g1_i1.p1  ORF type:complete len:105 (+),score=13.89 TRINITY_DN836_c0_g1_i1:17-331(+)
MMHTKKDTISLPYEAVHRRSLEHAQTLSLGRRGSAQKNVKQGGACGGIKKQNCFERSCASRGSHSTTRHVAHSANVHHPAPDIALGAPSIHLCSPLQENECSCD